MWGERKKSVSPQVSLSVFSLVPDLLFDCSRVHEYAKIRTVLQSSSFSDHNFINCFCSIGLQTTTAGNYLPNIIGDELLLNFGARFV